MICILYIESCVNLGWLYCYSFSSRFNFAFLSTSQEIGSEEHLRYDLFSVKWNVKC